MGLDVHLYRFKNLDTDAILKLSQFSEEPWAFEAFEKWNALPRSERGGFPSEKDKAESREKLVAKARELGLPEKLVDESCFGGVRVSVFSKKHPQRDIGTWGGLDVVLSITMHFFDKDAYSIFPEAKGDPEFFRPDWNAAKVRLAEILRRLKKLKPKQLESFLPSYWELFKKDLNEIDVAIETMDFVLNSGNPKEFLLCWNN